MGSGPVLEGTQLLIDLHTHTFPGSDDAFMGPDELVEAAKASGLDGACITEHDAFWDREDIIALSRRHDFLVLPGCEVNTDGGHVLVFGLDRYVFGMHKVALLKGLVDDAAGLMVAAHPYRRRYLEEEGRSPDRYREMLHKACIDPFFATCDAIEAFNGRATVGEAEFAGDLSSSFDLGRVGGGDCHRTEDLGKVATLFHGRVTEVEELIREVKAGRCEPVAMGDKSAAAAHPTVPQSTAERRADV